MAPLFHVTGMQGGMNGPMYVGNTVVMLPRWDRDVAAECVQRYRVSSWTAVPTMIQDFFANPDIAKYDLTSIRRLSGGGAAMPAAVAQRLLDVGITYYRRLRTDRDHGGHAHQSSAACQDSSAWASRSTASIRASSIRPRCSELPAGEVGEIVTHGPQVFLGYWNKPEDTAQAFVEIDGKRFLRTGDLGRVDEDGYFFMVDRLKRMINASGFKVWPTEVESLMYQHPAVLEACVIGTQGCAPRRDRQGRGRAAAGMARSGSRSRPSSTGAAKTWRRTKCRASSSSSMRCRSRAPARSCGASCRNVRRPPFPSEGDTTSCT